MNPLSRINQWLANYLTYNRAEQRGILVLSLLLLGLILFLALIPAETLQPAPDFRIFEADVAAFEKEWKRAADSDSLARVNRYRNYRKSFVGFHHDSATQPAKYQKPLLLVDLNVADTFALQQLRGIGPAFARRIVAYRGRLRGFYDRRQLMEVFGMDSARYLSIEENLQVTKDSVHPIDLNAVTFKELLRHPYFPFAITKNIMIYRQKNKLFRSLEELRRVEGVNDSIFRRMVIYLRLGP
ncbi:MAG: helix-hairpin-helix domain-containing protein [Bacteroidota bacterium]